MVATVRNPSGRIHWGALVIGILASSGVKNIPKYILADGPVVTPENAPGMIFMEDQFLL
jgi:ribose transport system substrate-binding protein